MFIWIHLNVTPMIFYLRQSWSSSWSHHTTRRNHVHAGIHIIDTNISSHTVTVGSTWTKQGSTGTIWARIRQWIHLRSTFNKNDYLNQVSNKDCNYISLSWFIYQSWINVFEITQHICGWGNKSKTQNDSSHFSIWWIISYENNKILLCE